MRLNVRTVRRDVGNRERPAHHQAVELHVRSRLVHCIKHFIQWTGIYWASVGSLYKSFYTVDRDLGDLGFIGPLSVHCIKVFIQWTGICWLDHQAVDVARPITATITRPSNFTSDHAWFTV
jgi:hypothetical protein